MIMVLNETIIYGVVIIMKPAPQILVSILVPVHNAEKYIYETIDNLLSERRVSLELIIIDDHSTDNSIKIINEFNDVRIRFFEANSYGVAGALNVGLLNAVGEIIMRCDADDLYTADRIFNQVNWLSNHLDYGAICGGFSAIDEEGRFVNELTKQYSSSLEITNELCEGTLRTSLCTFAVRAPLLRDLGGFRTYFKSSEDIDMQFRLAESCRIWYQKESVYNWRIHGLSITHTQENFERTFYEERAYEMQKQRSNGEEDDLMRGVIFSPEGLAKKNDFHSSSQHLAELLFGRAWQEYELGQFVSARRLCRESLFKDPWCFDRWKSFVVLIVKSFIRSLKKEFR